MVKRRFLPIVVAMMAETILPSAHSEVHSRPSNGFKRRSGTKTAFVDLFCGALPSRLTTTQGDKEFQREGGPSPVCRCRGGRYTHPPNSWFASDAAHVQVWCRPCLFVIFGASGDRIRRTYIRIRPQAGDQSRPSISLANKAGGFPCETRPEDCDPARDHSGVMGLVTGVAL